jgi:hypothetical protein
LTSVVVFHARRAGRPPGIGKVTSRASTSVGSLMSRARWFAKTVRRDAEVALDFATSPTGLSPTLFNATRTASEADSAAFESAEASGA